jgi:hypothetical protein
MIIFESVMTTFVLSIVFSCSASFLSLSKLDKYTKGFARQPLNLAGAYLFKLVRYFLDFRTYFRTYFLTFPRPLKKVGQLHLINSRRDFLQNFQIFLFFYKKFFVLSLFWHFVIIIFFLLDQ